MRVALNSDFQDYYDHCFEAPHLTQAQVWERYAAGNMARADLFAYLERLGLRTPLHGSPYQVAARVLGNDPSRIRESRMKDMELVVYTDPYSHHREGKIKMTLAEALQCYPAHLACEVIAANADGLGESLRYLRIGRRRFWLRYTSANDWRSNVGEVSIAVLHEEAPLPQACCDGVALPLFAIDFIRAWGRGGLYAVDFHAAPGLAGTGIEQYLPAPQVYNEIASALDGALALAA